MWVGHGQSPGGCERHQYPGIWASKERGCWWEARGRSPQGPGTFLCCLSFFLGPLIFPSFPIICHTWSLPQPPPWWPIHRQEAVTPLALHNCKNCSKVRT
jgi:hypothetical protein